MARSSITSTSDDLIDDSGSVLISLIQGESMDFPINLNFLDVIDNTYSLEAVVIEGNNDGNGSKPTTIQSPSPAEMTLQVRVPTDKGAWATDGIYLISDYVAHNGLFYLVIGSPTVALSPDLDPDNWEEFTPNRVFVELTEFISISPAFNETPEVSKPVYAFFELRVQEPPSAILRRTWKPVRGLIEVLFSPTALVP